MITLKSRNSKKIIFMRNGIKHLLLRKYCATVGMYEGWTKDQHECWQFTHLKRLLRRAELHVPYYRRRFREIGFTAHDLQSIQDIEKLPFVTKTIILENGAEAFCDERIPTFLRSRGNTGGSSGIPCPLLRFSPFSWLWEQAFMYQQWKRIGYKIGDKIGVLRGRIVNSKNRIYDYEEETNRLIFSSYDLNEDRAREYIKIMRDFQIQYLHVYPSSLALFIDCIRPSFSSLRIPSLKGIFVGSERMLPFQKELFEETFAVPCYHWYGHSEMALMGGWCEFAEKFNFLPEYGYLELISEDGKKIGNTDEAGELVGTGFHNPAMILIRYRTGDIGSGLRWDRCDCGRELPTLDQIHGRIQEYIIADDGCKIPVNCLFFGLHLPIFNCFRKVQLEQSNPGTVVVRLERSERGSYTREIESSKIAIEKALGKRVSFFFEEVDTIPLMANGKHRFILQYIKT